MSGKKVVLGVGGGIAAYKTAFLASRLVQSGFEVRVAMTPSATQFIGAVTFAGLTGHAPLLTTTQMQPDGQPAHLETAEDAAMLVIAPATADLLAKLAAGVCDDPVTLQAVCCQCPKLLCPAMNDTMWNASQVASKLETLRTLGFSLLGPVEGRLAEGYNAIGRMVEPDAILAAVQDRLK